MKKEWDERQNINFTVLATCAFVYDRDIGKHQKRERQNSYYRGTILNGG